MGLRIQRHHLVEVYIESWKPKIYSNRETESGATLSIISPGGVEGGEVDLPVLL